MSFDAVLLVVAAVALTAVLGELVWRRATGNRLPRDYRAAKQRAARTPSYAALTPTAVVALIGVRSHAWPLAVAGGLGFLVALVAYLRRRRQIFSGVDRRPPSP